MKVYWYLYNHCGLFGALRHFYLYVLKIEWWLQLVALLMLALLVIFARKRCKAGGFTKQQAFAIVNLPVYVFLLFSSLVFSRHTNAEMCINTNLLGKWISIVSGETKYVKEVCLNIIMLAPCGVMLPMILKTSITRTVVIGGAISMIIEIAQLVTRTGVCEVDDILHNTFGVVLGHGLFWLLTRMGRKRR